MVEFLQEYGILIALALIAIGAVVFVAVKEPKKAKEWLIWACSQAELALGGGTGMLKLREVYDMFITQFPIFSRFVPFTIFQKWTEEALVTFKNWLASNAIAQDLFGGGANGTEEK